MTEVDLVSWLREDLPAPVLDNAYARLFQELNSGSPAGAPGHRPPGAGRPARRRAARGRVRLIAAGTAAAVLAAGALAWQGYAGHSGPAGRTGPSHRQLAIKPWPVATGTELVAYATRAAAAAPPFRPGPHEWIYLKVLRATSSAGGAGFLLGPPNARQVTQSWTRVDGLQTAFLKHGRLVVDPVIPHSPRPLPAGWTSISYRYLDSLPTSPPRLRAMLAANLGSASSADIFTSIQALMSNVVLPPRLQAELYSVLVSLPGVHFADSSTDLAGRHGIGLFVLEDGYVKDEVVINPASYAYMGDIYIAIRAHTSTGLDGTWRVRKGQILGWAALLSSGIVRQAGQLPAG